MKVSCDRWIVSWKREWLFENADWAGSYLYLR